MGGYNLNKYIRTIVKMKIMFALILSILFLGSIILDISLLAKEKELKLELEAYSSANADEILAETFLKESEYYRENYQNINIENLTKQLQIINCLDYKQLEFGNDKTIIKMSKTTAESLGKSVEYLRNNGYGVELETVQKEGNEEFVEMEVKDYE
ncbi:MAG: hypothetical protein WBH44_09400 [Proteocatella sp.]